MKEKNKSLENLGIDPSASRMLSERSTTWANSPENWYSLYQIDLKP